MVEILVTGGAGVIGSALVRKLKSNAANITIIDDLSGSSRARVPDGVRFVHGSILDRSSLDDAFASRPRFVIHLASSFANQRSVDDPEHDLQTNALGSLRVFEACRRFGVGKVIYASSSCVYGNPASTDETLNSIELSTPYSMSKYMGERYAEHFVRSCGLNVAIMRLFNVYGPGEYPFEYRNVIPLFLARALARLPLRVMGDGSDTRDFTYIEDVIAGVELMMERETTQGGVLNLASGRPTTILELARMINHVTGNEAGVEFVPKRNWDIVAHRRGEIGKARRELGFDPRVDLRDGLARTLDWFRRRVLPPSDENAPAAPDLAHAD